MVVTERQIDNCTVNADHVFDLKLRFFRAPVKNASGGSHLSRFHHIEWKQIVEKDLLIVFGLHGESSSSVILTPLQIWNVISVDENHDFIEIMRHSIIQVDGFGENAYDRVAGFVNAEFQSDL